MLLLSKLPHERRSNLGDNLPARLHGTDQLENLGFVRNRAKGTVYHALSAGYTQIRVDYCSVFCVVFNGIYPTGRKAGLTWWEIAS